MWHFQYGPLIGGIASIVESPQSAAWAWELVGIKVSSKCGHQRRRIKRGEGIAVVTQYFVSLGDELEYSRPKPFVGNALQPDSFSIEKDSLDCFLISAERPVTRYDLDGFEIREDKAEKVEV